MPRPLSEEARTKALQAASALLAEFGLDGFSVDAVAKRSGVAKTTLYRHWAKASEMLVAALDCHVERVPAPDTGTLAGDLTQLFETMRTVSKPEASRHLLLATMAAAAKDAELARVQEAMVQERMRPIEEIVQRAVDRGEIAPIDPERAAVFAQGPFLARFMLYRHPLEADDVTHFVELVVRGLGGTPDPAGPGEPDQPASRSSAAR